MIRDTPAIKRIRESRHSISKKLDHDPKKVIEYYIEIQKKHKERLLNNEKETKESNHVSNITMA